MKEEMSPSIFDFKEMFREGIHLCYIFNDDKERVKTVAKFLASSLLTGHKILNIVDTVSPQDLRKELESLGIDMASKGRGIVTVDNEAAYCPNGVFDPDALLDGAVSFCRQASSEGYAGSRIYGDMSWVLRKNVNLADLMAYETKVNEYVKIPPCAAICEYDARKFNGATIMDILSVHPAMIISGHVVKNPYFKPPGEFLEQFKARQR
jgi:hypothetical protein